MDWYSRYLYCIVLSILDVHSSEVVLKDEPLNWREANEACPLINFSQVKTEYKKFVNQMVQEDAPISGYWIQDAVMEFSVVNKGCQQYVTILNSTTIATNMLSTCFQFCQKNSKTIGIKGNNCSCLKPMTYERYLPVSECDFLCVWEDRPCKMATFFFVFEQQDNIDKLGGEQIEECVSIGYSGTFKLNCSLKETYLCQKNDQLEMSLSEATWMEAVSNCAEKNQTLAYYQPSFNKFQSKKQHHWIGFRQYFKTEPVKQESSMCSVVYRYNVKDVKVESFNCNEKEKYICFEEPTSPQRSHHTRLTVHNNENIDQEPTTQQRRNLSRSIVNNTEPTTTRRIELKKSSHSVIINNEQDSQIHELEETRKSYLVEDSSDSSSSNVVGIVIGVLATLAILLLVFVCLFKRRRNNSRSAYQSPVVEYSTEQRRDSKQSQTKSVKSSPLKPARRSKKANPDSLVSGTEYENIVLTFEDPSTISRVVSSTSTDRTEILKEEENYDLMNTGNNETSSNVTSQNVYGFSPPEGEYDVMNRDNRNVNEFNPDYDHM